MESQSGNDEEVEAIARRKVDDVYAKNATLKDDELAAEIAWQLRDFEGELQLRGLVVDERVVLDLRRRLEDAREVPGRTRRAGAANLENGEED